MVVHNKSLLFKKVRDNILFFVLSKGVAFLAPIFFLNFVSLEECYEMMYKEPVQESDIRGLVLDTVSRFYHNIRDGR